MKSKMQEPPDAYSVNTEDFYDGYDFESDSESTLQSTKSPSLSTRLSSERHTVIETSRESKSNDYKSHYDSDSDKRGGPGQAADGGTFRRNSIDSRASDLTQAQSPSASRLTEKKEMMSRKHERPLPARKGWSRNARNASFGYTHLKSGNAPRINHMRVGGLQNSTAKRVLSAKRKNFSEIQNQVNELELEVGKLRLENRDLKRTVQLQAKALTKLDNDEAELPKLIQKHNNDLKVLKDKAKKAKLSSDRSLQELKKKDHEMLRMKDKVKRLEEIVEGKHLYRKEKVNKQLDIIQEQLKEKEIKISDLEKSIALHAKVRQRESKERNEKYRKAQEELKQLEGRHLYLQQKLKDKEKELDTKNLYTQTITHKKRQEGWRGFDSPFSASRSSAMSHKLDAFITQSTPTDKEQHRNSINSPRAESKVETMIMKQRQERKKSVNYEKRLKLQLEEKIRQEMEQEKQFRESEDRRIREEIHQREIKLRVEEENAKKGEMKKIDNGIKETPHLTMLELNIQRDMEEGLAEQGRRLEKQESKTDSVAPMQSTIDSVETCVTGQAETVDIEKQKEIEMQHTDDSQKEIEKQRRENEEEKIKQDKEFEEANRKRALLLERMRAIDEGKDPSTVVVPSLTTTQKQQSTNNIAPIVLQSKIEYPNKNEHVVGANTENNTFQSNGADTVHATRWSANSKPTEHNLPASASAAAGSRVFSSITEKQSGPKNEDIVFGSYRPSLGMKDTDPENFLDSRGRPVYGRRGAPQGLVQGHSSNAIEKRSQSPAFDLSTGPDHSRGAQPRQRQRPGGITNTFGDDIFSDSPPSFNKSGDDSTRPQTDTLHNSHGNHNSSSGRANQTNFRGPRPYIADAKVALKGRSELGAFDDGLEELVLI